MERVSRHSRSLVETDVLHDQDFEAPLIVASFELLSRICYHLNRNSVQDNHHHASSADNSSTVGEQTSARNHFLASLAATEGAGTVGALYAALVLPGHSPQKSSSPTPNQAALSNASRTLGLEALTLLRNFAEMDLQKFQVSFGFPRSNMRFSLSFVFLNNLPRSLKV